MTIEELEQCCDKSEAGTTIGKPQITLVVPGKQAGRRKRVFPGVMGVVVDERYRGEKVFCTVIVDCADVRKAIARHRTHESRLAR